MPMFPTSELHATGNRPGAPDKEVCDLDKLVERCLGDVPLAAKLLKRFEERLLKTIREIDRTLEDEDYAQALKRVHSLKGEAASLAAYRLQQAAIDLENCLHTEHCRTDQDISRAADALHAAAEQCGRQVPLALDALAMLSPT